jgi:hypothetical protein
MQEMDRLKSLGMKRGVVEYDEVSVLVFGLSETAPPFRVPKEQRRLYELQVASYEASERALKARQATKPLWGLGAILTNAVRGAEALEAEADVAWLAVMTEAGALGVGSVHRYRP